MNRLLKHLLILSATFLMVACSSDEDCVQTMSDGMNLQPDATLQVVMDLATYEAESLFPAKSRSEMREADVSSIKIIGRNSSRSLDDTLIYVVNYKDDKGFALIAATEMDSPVLAVVPEGRFDPEVGTDNPGFNLFLNAAIKTCSQQPKANITPITKVEKDSTEGVLGLDGKYHKYTTKVLINRSRDAWTGFDLKWNQNGIYGKYCPNGLCGCVPLTIATIMTYLRTIDNNNMTKNYGFPEADINGETLSFAELFKHKSSEEINESPAYIITGHLCTAVDDAHDQIGRLCRQIGHEAGNKLTYYTDITGNAVTSFSDFPTGEMYNYISSQLSPYTVQNFTKYSFGSLMNAVDKGILFLRGYYPSATYMGHAWYCDAYIRYKAEITEYESLDPNSGPFAWIRVGTRIDDRSLAWMHWGWGGMYDGWFKWDAMDPLNYGESMSVEAALVEIPESLR